MRYNYWSCSKFADWLRGTSKPRAGTSQEWKDWHKAARAKKIRYWLAEDGLDYLQDFVNWPLDRISDIRRYINNRWISKTHALTSTLKRGQWHEFDTRLLYSAFDELVDYVEIEEASMHIICSDEDSKKYKTPWYRAIFRIGSWRCPEAGQAHLEWAAGLKADEEWMDKNDPNYGLPTTHALAAQETLALYKWWKEERPKRPEARDASGWSDFCEERRNAATARGDESWDYFEEYESEEEQERAGKIHDIYRKLEQGQEDEDTEMLIRLVKLRTRLWT